ncbi:MAG: hypothetical protein V7607_2932 [Solirubrobacteraceae bacterium]
MRRIIVVGAVGAIALIAAAVAVAQIVSGVPNANPRSGSPANVMASGFMLQRVVNGNDNLENPAGIFSRYGYLDDSTLQKDRQPTKTEPDQNTYLVTNRNPGGPTAGYDYGHRFLIQGHEVFTPSDQTYNRAYFTRINLDVKDPAHRITLLNPLPSDATDSGLRSLDGSTYDPFTGQLLFTAEAGPGGGVFGQPLKWSGATAPAVKSYDGSIGKAGYEGIHNDKLGNLIIVEDTGGVTVTDNGTATQVKQPNSFVFRFKPKSPSDLTQGRLQALQVSVDGKPIVFHSLATDGAQAVRDDALGDPIKALHSGQSLEAKWVTVHDTDVDGSAPFDANALAKSKQGTPLKRPENGKFVPGTGFKSFVFDETGDTNKTAGDYPGAAERGAWGALLRLDLPKAGADTGTIKTIVEGDQAHASFDNVAFLDKNTVLVTEDRGETLHQQANALDSLWSFDITKPLDEINADARRLEAQGRDPEATGDIAIKEPAPPTALTHNDGDNELTGIHVSDGSTSPDGILGSDLPSNAGGWSPWRIFVTGQHGANITYEILATGKHKNGR